MKVRNEFKFLNSLFIQHQPWIIEHAGKAPILSMGMSGDYSMAIEEGSTLVRIVVYYLAQEIMLNKKANHPIRFLC
jgi:uncharacterized pyridoxal phosphate-containing UPF0001 family protein